MSEVQRISYKTVSKAELGFTKGNITHIGFALKTFDKWSYGELLEIMNVNVWSNKYILDCLFLGYVFNCSFC